MCRLLGRSRAATAATRGDPAGVLHALALVVDTAIAALAANLKACPTATATATATITARATDSPSSTRRIARVSSSVAVYGRSVPTTTPPSTARHRNANSRRTARPCLAPSAGRAHASPSPAFPAGERERLLADAYGRGPSAFARRAVAIAASATGATVSDHHVYDLVRRNGEHDGFRLYSVAPGPAAAISCASSTARRTGASTATAAGSDHHDRVGVAWNLFVVGAGSEKSRHRCNCVPLRAGLR